MGEYATRKDDGESVKIGTCENMYYLRYDQRDEVTGDGHSLTPSDPDVIGELRFRFPDPLEDGKAPGSFDDMWPRALRVPGYVAPEGVEHGTVQFKASNDTGWLVSIPCPEASTVGGLTMHRNGYNGGQQLVAQKVIGGELIPVLVCRTCGSMWRAEGQARADLAQYFLERAADEIREASLTFVASDPDLVRQHGDSARRFLTLASRVMAKADSN